MTSEERRECRYQRRKAKRQANLQKRNDAIKPLEEIFTVANLYSAGKQVCKSVRWKQSTQNFESHLIRHAVDARNAVLSGTYKPKKYKHFQIKERGKDREIDAPHIIDRMVQRVISNEILTPLYEDSMIYNNCASQKGKGLNMSFKLLKRDMRKHFKKYGMNGYVITIDFHEFFPSASHEVILERHKRLILDDRIRDLCDAIIKTLPNDIGMPLGIEPSQVEMIGYTSALDNYIQCQLSLCGVGHYMDDYYILVPPDSDPKLILEQFNAKAKEIGLTLNLNKTKILKFGKPFKYCKSKFQILSSGKVIHHCNRQSYINACRKLPKFKRKIDNGEMTYIRLYQFINSIFAYIKRYNSFTRLQNLKQRFTSIFGFYPHSYETFRFLDYNRSENEIHNI